MKAIGLLGGMSWESTQVYYRLINQFTAERLAEPAHTHCFREPL
jgi:aspartate racemase